MLKKIHVLVIPTVVIIIGLGYSNSELVDELIIPDWIKNKASWWPNGQIWESDNISALHYLDNKGSTSIPITETIVTDEKIFDSDKSSPPTIWPEEVFGTITRLSFRDSTGDQIAPSFRVTFESTEFPLTLNGTNYRLDQIKNVTLTKVEIGKPLKLQIRMYENEGTDNVQHVMLYLNQHGPKILNDLTETGITYEKGKTTQIIDYNNLIENATITQSIEGHKNVFEFEVKFSKKMETSDLLFRVWDYPRNSIDMYIPNALVVTDTSASLKNVPNNVLPESVAKLNDTEETNLKPSLLENKILVPLKQFKDRNHLEDITCKEGMVLVMKASDGSPACVTPETKIKLIERGWTKEITKTNSQNVFLEGFQDFYVINDSIKFTLVFKAGQKCGTIELSLIDTKTSKFVNGVGFDDMCNSPYLSEDLRIGIPYQEDNSPFKTDKVGSYKIVITNGGEIVLEKEFVVKSTV